VIPALVGALVMLVAGIVVVLGREASTSLTDGMALWGVLIRSTPHSLCPLIFPDDAPRSSGLRTPGRLRSAGNLGDRERHLHRWAADVAPSDPVLVSDLARNAGAWFVSAWQYAD